MKRPSGFKQPPLIEAVFEIRVVPAVQSAGELLPGLLFGQLRHLFDKVEQAPMGAIPRELRQRPELKYLPQSKLVGKNETLLLGDNIVALARNPPYGNWKSFLQR